MNIFATDRDPVKAADYLFEHTSFKRANKMVLESAQLLATAIQMHGGNATYRPTHKNHPVAIWARLTRDNYKWLLSHFERLCDNFERVRGKTHKCKDYLPEFRQGIEIIPIGELTDFANCARNKTQGFDFSHIPDVCQAYREYLKVKE